MVSSPAAGAPLPPSPGLAVEWHLSKVGGGAAAVLSGLRVRCEPLNAVPLPSEAAAVLSEAACGAVGLFHSWAAQVMQRSSANLLQLCTMHSDARSVAAALQQLRPLLGPDDGDEGSGLAAAGGRLAALQQAIGLQLSSGIDESAASFFALLPDKYWAPSRKDASAARPEGGAAAEGAAGEYMQRLVSELLAPAAKSLRKLDPASAEELLPTIVDASLDSCVHTFSRSHASYCRS